MKIKIDDDEIDLGTFGQKRNFEEDCEIDRTNLEGELETHNKKFSYYAFLYDLATEKADLAKRDFERVCANLDIIVRKQFKDSKLKFTEAMVSNEMKQSSAYDKAYERHSEAKKLASMLKHCRDSMNTRKEALIVMCKNEYSGRFNDTSYLASQITDKLQKLKGKDGEE